MHSAALVLVGFACALVEGMVLAGRRGNLRSAMKPIPDTADEQLDEADSSSNLQSLKALAKFLLGFIPASAFLPSGTMMCSHTSSLPVLLPCLPCCHHLQHLKGLQMTLTEQDLATEAASSTQVVSMGMQVQVDFTVVRTDTGDTLDTTKDSQPLTFVCGLEQKGVLSKLHTAVDGMAIGETRKLPITDFGEHDATRVSHVPLENIPPGMYVGAKLQTQGGGQVRIFGMNDTHASLDFNHPLAGVPISLTVTVLSAQDDVSEGESQESPRVCVVCLKPARIHCSKNDHVLYCSSDCQKRHWDELGYNETCHLANSDFQLDQLAPPTAIEVLEMSEVTSQTFQQYLSDEGRPVVLRGVFGEAFSKSMWDLDSLVESFGRDTEIDLRYYRGSASTPGKWVDRNVYCHARSSVGKYAEMIRSGYAKTQDAYVMTDLVETPAILSQLGQVLKDGLEEISERTGLRISKSQGEAVNLWWGAPGHTEPLHCDAPDGTLVQLRGRKRVILFPASEWTHLYPLPVSARASNYWSRINLADIDVQSYPYVRKALLRRHEVILEEGDALFIPACWGHQVTGLEEEGESSSDSAHVFSINRFWGTDLDRSIRWQPEEFRRIIKEYYPEGI